MTCLNCRSSGSNDLRLSSGISPEKVASDVVLDSILDDDFPLKSNINNDSIIYPIANYIKIHMAQKVIVTRETISNIEAKLPKNDFIRIHRSYILSMAKTKNMKRKEVDYYFLF